jgi:hypothetical protein
MQLVSALAKLLKCLRSTVVTLPEVGQSLLESEFAVLSELFEAFSRTRIYSHFAK